MTRALNSSTSLPVSLVLIATLAGLLAAMPSQAQTRAALVQSVDEPGRQPYQEKVRIPCTGADQTEATFSTVPAGKRLVLTHIGGFLDTAQGSLPDGLVYSATGGEGVANIRSTEALLAFTGTRGATGASSVRVYFNQAVQAYLPPNDYARMRYTLTSPGDRCAGHAVMVLTGYFVNLP